MTMLQRHQALTWTLELCDGGYTCATLYDEHGRRWAWVVDASDTGWMAHVGDWGQADRVGMDSPPVDQTLEHFDKISDAKAWCEEIVAVCWSRARRYRKPA